MESIGLLAIAAVLIIVVVSAFAPRLGVAAPILLVLVGLGCSLVPEIPDLVIEPDWILVVVLPPLLYAAAVNVPTTDFRRELGTISALSVGLVVVSAFVVGFILWRIFPELGLAGAVAVGAVVSPPDAVAATSIGKRLGLPGRLVTILEGEGLVNDATALVTLRTAIAAVGTSISFWGVLGDFAYAVTVALLIGGIVGAVSVWLRSQLSQPVQTTAISFIVPFVAFIPAEEVGASGVIAVVVAGLITSAQSAKRFSAQDRISERTNWRTILLLLENGVFLLMGYQLTFLIGQVRASGESVGQAVMIGLLVVVVLVVVRTAFVFPMVEYMGRHHRLSASRPRPVVTLVRRVTAKIAPDDGRMQERADRKRRRREADLTFYENEGLDWRGSAVISWAGMRGVVTLAAAQTLPFGMAHRPQLILVAFTVAVVTLVLQGSTLPLLIRLLGIRGTDMEEQRREFGRLMAEIGETAQAFLKSPSLKRHDGKPFDPQVVAQVQRSSVAISNAAAVLEVGGSNTFKQRFELQGRLLDVEHAALLDARASGSYRSSTIEAAQNLIDSNVARLERPHSG